jgi:hypothetical protein
MKSLKIAGLCLVAMFVMSMVAEATASAEETKPYFIQCREVTAKKGSWKNEQCSEALKEGNWETRAGGSMGDETYSSTSGVGKLETVAAKPKIIECESDRDSGQITGPKTVGRVTLCLRLASM